MTPAEAKRLRKRLAELKLRARKQERLIKTLQKDSLQNEKAYVMALTLIVTLALNLGLKNNDIVRIWRRSHRDAKKVMEKREFRKIMKGLGRK